VCARIRLLSSVVIICSAYRSPSTQKTNGLTARSANDFYDDLSEMLLPLSDVNAEIIIAGDTNANMFDGRMLSIVDGFCESTNMRQIVDFPTHDDALLDHIYVTRSTTTSHVTHPSRSGIRQLQHKSHVQVWSAVVLRNDVCAAGLRWIGRCVGLHSWTNIWMKPSATPAQSKWLGRRSVRRVIW
jgi:hypothetical protein